MTYDDKRVPAAMKEKLASIISGAEDPSELLQAVCDYLCTHMENCHWAGYYLVDRDKEDELVLGPYCGAPTDHVRIPFGDGICGQAASTLETFVIQDVSKESNYLSCSPLVRSEIVVPVFSSGKLVGEIDLDSHETGGFSEEDRALLEWLADRTSTHADRAGKVLTDSLD
jgi:L-methionine (R)-S-oxide reductase